MYKQILNPNFRSENKKNALLKFLISTIITITLLSLIIFVFVMYFQPPTIYYDFEVLTSYPEPACLDFSVIYWEDGNLLFMIGGYIPNSLDDHGKPLYLNRTLIYDFPRQSWERGDDMLVPIRATISKVFGNYIYIFGGMVYNETEGDPYWSSTDHIYRYSLIENKWEFIGLMSKKRSSHNVIIIEENAYIFGGMEEKMNSTGKTINWITDLDICNLVTLDCYLYPNITFIPRYNLSLLEYQKHIVILGGTDPDDKISDKIELFDPVIKDNILNRTLIIEASDDYFDLGKMDRNSVIIFKGNSNITNIYKMDIAAEQSDINKIVGHLSDMSTQEILNTKKSQMTIFQHKDCCLGLLGGVISNTTVTDFLILKKIIKPPLFPREIS